MEEVALKQHTEQDGKQPAEQPPLAPAVPAAWQVIAGESRPGTALQSVPSTASTELRPGTAVQNSAVSPRTPFIRKASISDIGEGIELPPIQQPTHRRNSGHKRSSDYAHHLGASPKRPSSSPSLGFTDAPTIGICNAEGGPPAPSGFLTEVLADAVLQTPSGRRTSQGQLRHNNSEESLFPQSTPDVRRAKASPRPSSGASDKFDWQSSQSNPGALTPERSTSLTPSNSTSICRHLGAGGASCELPAEADELLPAPTPPQSARQRRTAPREIKAAIMARRGSCLEDFNFWKPTNIRKRRYHRLDASENLGGDPPKTAREKTIDRCKCRGMSLACASPCDRGCREVVLAAVAESGRALQFAMEPLRNDKEVILVAVKNDGYALRFASQILRRDFEVVLAAVTQNGLALSFAHKELRENRQVVEAAATQNGIALQFASPGLRKDRECKALALSRVPAEGKWVSAPSPLQSVDGRWPSTRAWNPLLSLSASDSSAEMTEIKKAHSRKNAKRNATVGDILFTEFVPDTNLLGVKYGTIKVY
eukprot:TRINITY_DN14776_c0_g1_i1.p1 TRINITY_DN14776_c0_g1~~TRINITY_DN14776_c0_g1_i1.p1  ORF type:complete len:538 (-),score=101.48 TRINITY_DN14776_c0_g1_i1:432-2045(-)